MILPDKAAITEALFQQWYAQHGVGHGLAPNPDDPMQRYDYRGAYKAGVTPSFHPEYVDPKTGDTGWHWPSEFKAPDHPNRFVNGIDTITGKPVK